MRFQVHLVRNDIKRNAVKVFFTEEAAYKWIESNNHCLLINDYFIVTEKEYNY